MADHKETSLSARLSLLWRGVLPACVVATGLWFTTAAARADQLVATQVLDLRAWCGKEGAILGVASGNGAHVAWHSLTSGRRMLLSSKEVPINGGTYVSVHHGGNCSPDGRWILFTDGALSRPNGRFSLAALLLADTATGKLIRLGYAYDIDVSWSPDSRSFLHFVNEGMIDPHGHCGSCPGSTVDARRGMRPVKGLNAVDAWRILRDADPLVAQLFVGNGWQDIRWHISDAVWVDADAVLVTVLQSQRANEVFLLSTVTTKPTIFRLDFGDPTAIALPFPRISGDDIPPLLAKAHCKLSGIAEERIACYDRSGWDVDRMESRDFDLAAHCAVNRTAATSKLCGLKPSKPLELYQHGNVMLVWDARTKTRGDTAFRIGDLYRLSGSP